MVCAVAQDSQTSYNLRAQILNAVGARPNLPKIAPLLREMQRHAEFTAILVHTGQHYNENLSDIFFRQMGIPAPQVNLEVGSGSHASPDGGNPEAVGARKKHPS